MLPSFAAHSMLSRIATLVRTHLAGQWFGDGGANLPVAPLLVQGLLSAALCWIAAELPLFAYGVFALSIPLALATLPLLGELAPLLRADPAAEWVGALPVRPFELRAARVCVLFVLVGTLALAALVPAALLAPAEFGVLQRIGLIALGLVQTGAVAAALLWVQAILGRRAETLLVFVQTLVFAAVVVGSVTGLRYLPQLSKLQGPSGLLEAYPPAWFATWLLDAPFDYATTAWLALGAAGFAALTFALAPFPPPVRARRASAVLSFLLTPVRALATRFWVRREERGVFDLVYDGLPAERDFVLRTYPLIAVPVAFLLLGSQDGDPKGEGLLAILLFAPAIYLPVLLVHIPATATPAARWIVDTAPIAPEAVRNAAIKAIAVRFLLPLYVGLALVTWVQSDAALTLRLALPGAAVAYVVLRVTYSKCVGAPPLSTSISELGAAFEGDLTGLMFLLAMVQTLLAIAVYRFVSTPVLGVVVFAGLVVYELVASRRAYREALP